MNLVANADELRQCLGREAHILAPAEVLAPGADISAALKESLSTVRRKKQASRKHAHLVVQRAAHLL